MSDDFEAAAVALERRAGLGRPVWDDHRGGRCYRRQDGDAVRLTIVRDGQRDTVGIYEGVDLDALS